MWGKMQADLSKITTVLRFEVQVPRAEYKTLMAHLRGEGQVHAATKNSAHGAVTALLDLTPESSTFLITKLGRHKLPKSVSIKAGSATHYLLAHTIADELKRIKDPAVTARLRAIIDACPAPLPQSLRVHPNDFEIAKNTAATGLHSTNPLNQHSPELAHNASVSVLGTLAPTFMLDLDDTPTLVIPETPTHTDRSIHEVVRDALSETLAAKVSVSGSNATLSGSVCIPTLSSRTCITLFAHWGSYDELAGPWQDEELVTGALEKSNAGFSDNRFDFATTLQTTAQGAYGVSFYATINNSSDRIWIGRLWHDDLRFSVSQDDPSVVISTYKKRQALFVEATKQAHALLGDPKQALAILSWYREHAPQLSLGAILAAETSHSRAARGVLDNAVTSLREHGELEVADHIATTYGVGEIVFATPEGPHATAGGLAHVITGLPQELASHGIPVTIIAPLYRYTNGNKHPRAEAILEHGVNLGGRKVIPHYAATISVQLGPTHFSNTGFHKRPATTVKCKVYTVEAGPLRLVLLANTSAFDRIYNPVYADEQLRRAIVLSRAVLETIATERLGIRPTALISNDWMTACVPSLLALDPRYRAIPWLANAKAIHMIHNGGADYHGRLPIHFGNEDLWPLFSLAPEHFFGFKDPHRPDLINLTMAAARHASGGVITVSQPYARALISDNGGDGLERILKPRRDVVFGVSNGINRSDIDAYLAARLSCNISALGDASSLITAKSKIRLDMQRALGLDLQPSAQIVSFVGRLAEQKGLDLLTGFVNNTSHSTLEDILIRHPQAQIIIAGPITGSDRSATALYEATRYLQHRYPGRIAAMFDYISHSTAIDIMAASTLFLMPSRFEPGGITQLEALAAGTPVVGRSVDGISATIENFNSTSGQGTGFLCHDYTPTGFANTTHWALTTCANDKLYRSIVQQAISAKHRWSDRAPTFLAVLQRIILGAAGVDELEFLDSLAPLVSAAQA